MSKPAPVSAWVAIRPDLIRAVVLALLAILIWCTIYHRWTAESWQMPTTYLSDPERGDVIDTLARIRAARDGHMLPLLYTNVPELGAPRIANWNDFPMTEKPFFCLTGMLASIVGLFAAANIALLLGQVLAALAFYTACRLLNCSWVWAFMGALVFAFSHFAFAQGLYHLTITYYWHLPLCLLVCEWIFRKDGIRFGEWRFNFALVVAFITGIQHVYYTNLFAQFVLFGGLVQGWRHGWKKALPAAAIIGTAVGTFLLMNLNTLFYQLAYGGNPGALVRDYKWLEIYGLKLVDLVVPPPDHPFPLFSWWGTDHLKEIILSPGETPPSAYLGLLGLGALTWLVISSLRRVLSGDRLPLEAYLVLWIILYASVGGINGIEGTWGFQLFRATTRYSIFILCIVLMYAVRQLSQMRLNPWLAYGTAGVLTALAIWDQSPPWVTDQDLAETTRQVNSDRQFTEKMEARLAPHAMVFQIPVMEFPEKPAPGVGSYDHFRPYLYSHQLRFSFGSDKGRMDEAWQHQLEELPFKEVVSRLESYGFGAIYVNRNGFSDHGEGLIKVMRDSGLNEIIESDKGDLFCVILKPSPNPVAPFSL